MPAQAELPDKLSELLAVALHDMDQVRALPGRFVIDMSMWHTPVQTQDVSICQVCLAGAVMAMTLEIPDRVFSEPYLLDSSNKLSALDYLRTGNVFGAARTMGTVMPAVISDAGQALLAFTTIEFKGDNHQHLDEHGGIIPNDEVYENWRQDMDELVTLLQKYGL